MSGSIDRATLKRLLQTASGPGIPQASRAVDTADERQWMLAQQTASRWGPALSLKYSQVRERGFHVVGLEALVGRLESIDGEVTGVALGGDGSTTVLIVLDPDLTEVLGVLIASPPPA